MEDPKWIEIAKKEIGIHECASDEKRILEYFTATSYKAQSDTVPWCSAFVNWCMKEAGITGSDSAAAKSWLTWGN